MSGESKRPKWLPEVASDEMIAMRTLRICKTEPEQKSIEQIAEEVCDLYTSMDIRACATVEGIRWTCEIYQDSPYRELGLAEEMATAEEAANEAYRQWLEWRARER
ncbi:hypothetical protein [Alicyclobacillus macrosporangiidus]|uniref:Uncharacterized protein n=1 Tax=Alicyclobacillus macrosporangiidus TaxID=392015 RepID=A0A1I7ICR4_9BACL|nr:hypothetical protein [Alicyclobacillus macrosporangiidus]SFU70707.1 hypothetical protein SAMN05421543_106138 [Alicyclobacillus macrosporangiidus]